MKNKSNSAKIPCAIVAIVACLALAGRADGTVFYSTDFSSGSGWSSNLDAPSGMGGSILDANPFVVNGASLGNYMSATSYPTTLLNQTALASSTPDLWLGFLMRVDSGNYWAGGVGLCAGSTYTQIILGPWDGTAGWHQATMQLTLVNADYTAVAPNNLPMSDGSVAAVLAHFYDKTGAGTYNTADLWVQTDLSTSLFGSISAISALDYQFSLGANPSDSVNSIRLLAEGNEIRSYDKVVLATSSTEAVGFLNGTVPEPPTSAFLLFGAGVAAFFLRRRRDA